MKSHNKILLKTNTLQIVFLFVLVGFFSIVAKSQETSSGFAFGFMSGYTNYHKFIPGVNAGYHYEYIPKIKYISLKSKIEIMNSSIIEDNFILNHSNAISFIYGDRIKWKIEGSIGTCFRPFQNYIYEWINISCGLSTGLEFRITESFSLFIDIGVNGYRYKTLGIVHGNSQYVKYFNVYRNYGFGLKFYLLK